MGTYTTFILFLFFYYYIIMLKSLYSITFIFALLSVASATTTYTFDKADGSCALTTDFYQYTFVSSDVGNCWRMRSGTTPSSATGPNGAFSGACYLYLETSGTCKPSKNEYFHMGRYYNAARISFNYHMYGSTMGTFKLQLYSLEGRSYVKLEEYLVASGDQGNVWKNFEVDVSEYGGKNIYVVLYGLSGSSYRSDIAVDNFSVDFCGDIENGYYNSGTLQCDQCHSNQFDSNGICRCYNGQWVERPDDEPYGKEKEYHERKINERKINERKKFTSVSE